MAIEVYFWVKRKQYKVYVEGGWYSGEPFYLFQLHLLGVDDGTIRLLNIQIAKLLFSIGGYEVA